MTVAEKSLKEALVGQWNDLGQKMLALGEAIPAAAFDKRPEVRLAAVRILGAIGPDASGAEGALLLARGDADPALRTAAEAALERIRGQPPTPTPSK